MKEIFSESPEDTFELGRRLGEAAFPGMVVCLDGALGTGKTVFAKGFAKGLGIDEPVSSPTFTILQCYEEGRLPFFHFDVYRISDPEEMDEIGYEEYFFGKGTCLIEWSELIGSLIPETAVRIRLSRLQGEGYDRRRVTISNCPEL